MKNIVIDTRASRFSFLSNSYAIDAQILENIPAQKSEYEFLKHSIKNYDIFVIALNRYENGKSRPQLSQTQLNVIFEKISEKIAEFRRKNPDKYIFVLFSESFFGSDPLTDVQSMVDKCKSLSNRRRVVIQASFLHRFNEKHTPLWLHNYKPITDVKQIAQRITRDEKEAPKFLIADENHKDRIANYTLTFCFGRILTIYRKSTYCRAADKLLIKDRTHAYEFGDFQSHKLLKSPIADLFCEENPLIATRMCSDMNDPHISSATKLIIVHANDHPTDQSHYKNISVPILFIDDKGIAVSRVVQKRIKFSRKIFHKPIDLRLKTNPNFICRNSYFRCFPFELSKILSMPPNCEYQILDAVSYDLNLI